MIDRGVRRLLWVQVILWCLIIGGLLIRFATRTNPW